MRRRGVRNFISDFSYWFVQRVVRLGFGLVARRMKVEGLREIPLGEKRMIVVANHLSHLDPPLVGCVIPKKVYFLAKEELFRIPVVGFFLKLWDQIPVYRGVKREGYSALEVARARLREDSWVLIFPEGTRSRDGKFHPEKMKKGAAVLACEEKVPLLPVAIKGTYELMPPGSKGIRFRKASISLKFGAPFTVDGDGKECIERALETIGERIKSLLES